MVEFITVTCIITLAVALYKSGMRILALPVFITGLFIFLYNCTG